MCRRIGSLPVAIIATMRAWPEEARNLASSLVGSGVGRLCRLAPLSHEGSTKVLMERAGRPVSDAVGQGSWSAGNPLLLEQVALAIGRGAFDAEAVRTGPRWRPTACCSAASLGCPGRRCVACGPRACSGSLPSGRGGRGCRTGSDRRRPGGRGALSERPGRTDHAGVRFVHPLARAGALRRSSRSGAGAAARPQLRGAGSARLDAEAAEHALRAGLRDAPEVVAALLERRTGGARRRSLGNGRRPADHRRRARRGSGGDVVAPGQAEALLGAGDPIAASVAYERVLSRRVGADVRAGALRMRGRALYASGDHVTAAACSRKPRI